MKKTLIGIIVLLSIIACAGNAIIREYKYAYKMKSADDVLYDIITIVRNNNFELAGTGNTTQSINTTHGAFLVDVVETDWANTGISNNAGEEYQLKYRIWVPVEGAMKMSNPSGLNDSMSNDGGGSMFSENVVSIESFVRVQEDGEYKIKEAIPRELFVYLEKVPIEISGILEHVGMSDESKLRVQQEKDK